MKCRCKAKVRRLLERTVLMFQSEQATERRSNRVKLYVRQEDRILFGTQICATQDHRMLEYKLLRRSIGGGVEGTTGAESCLVNLCRFL
jgi:hypothetical protein